MKSQSFCLAALVVVNMVLQTALAAPSVAPATTTLVALAVLLLTAAAAFVLAERKYAAPFPRARGPYAFLATYLLLTGAAGFWFGREWPRLYHLIGHIDASLIVRVVITACAIAVTEEIIYRQWLLGLLRKRMHGAVAVLLSALLFHLAHFTLLPTPLLLGLILGYLANRYQSLVVPVLVHLVYDAIWMMGDVARTVPVPGPQAAVSDENLFRTVAATGFMAFTLAALAYIAVLAFLDWRAARRTAAAPVSVSQP